MMKRLAMPAAILLSLAAATAVAQPGQPDALQEALRAEQLRNDLLSTAIAQANRNTQRTLAAQQAPAADPNRPMTDLYALINRLADEMDKEFIVPTYLSPNSLGWSTIDEGADFETLQGLLRASNLAVIETADQVFIVNDATSRAEPSIVLTDDDRRISDHTIVTRILNVDNVPVAQLIPILRPMMPQSGQMTAVQGTTTLILVDRYDNIRRLTAVIEAIDESAAAD